MLLAVKLVLVQPELSYEASSNNHAVLVRLLDPVASSLTASDVVLLPEHFDLRASRADYEQGICGLAQRLGCHVVGGSHHEERDGGRVNRGVVSDSSGQIIGAYEKLRPYADERSRVQQGTALGELSIGGRPMLVLICADFWFSDVFYRTSQLPALVLVPAHSVSRKPTPDYSRALWRHVAVARAYEFGVYVGVSDWAHGAVGSRTPGGPGRIAPSGVGGLADPTRVDPEQLYLPIAGALRVYELDFAALDAFRRDRMARGFFWKPMPPAP
jgi:predicted amidohydrolase